MNTALISYFLIATKVALFAGLIMVPLCVREWILLMHDLKLRQTLISDEDFKSFQIIYYAQSVITPDTVMIKRERKLATRVTNRTHAYAGG